MPPSCESLRRFIRDESGAVATEYAILATLIAVAIVAGATILGEGLNTAYSNLAACVASLPAATAC